MFQELTAGDWGGDRESKMIGALVGIATVVVGVGIIMIWNNSKSAAPAKDPYANIVHEGDETVKSAEESQREREEAMAEELEAAEAEAPAAGSPFGSYTLTGKNSLRAKVLPSKVCSTR